MSEPQTSRPFRERFLDGFDRSQLQKEVERVKPRRGLSGFRKRAASWGLGATLALGGLGVPLKMSSFHQHAGGHQKDAAESTAPQSAPPDAAPGIASDLNAATQIANQVATGVQGAATTIANTAAAAPAAAAQV